uniref:G-protein coupled receptors family 3 profile domain-containing protein n=1 Tax=Cynoglossus semilaevis TaxID=244447 RepID=A0A3P8VXW1_CYNSE
ISSLKMMNRSVLFSLVLYLSVAPGCKRIGKFDVPGWFKQGDIVIGGIFPVYNREVVSIFNYEKKPTSVNCDRFDLRAFRWTQMMIFAIEEINKDPTILLNVTLGYRILDSCSSPTNTLRAALTLVGGQEENNSTCFPAVSAIVAEAESSQSIAVASTVGPFQVPIVSYFSTCACLSDRTKYPTFFRTVPSDYYQAKALAALVKRFGWKWIGALQADNDYGRNGIQAFTYSVDKTLRVLEMIKKSTVKVILAFTAEGDFYPLMKEVVKQNITGIQWIASEAWITSSRLSTPEMFQAFGGALGFVMPKMAVPNLKPFLTSISPHADSGAVFVRTFWEIIMGCTPHLSGENSTSSLDGMCTGDETLSDSQDPFFDVTELRVSYNVYNAIYAIAHALHRVVFCKSRHKWPNPHNQPCLQRVHFVNTFGDSIFFDENGDPPASYEVINWQLRDGEVHHVSLGHFASAVNVLAPMSPQIPTSVCSEVCPVGTRKAQIKGKPICCFECIPCAEGSIANMTGAVDCVPCPVKFWSSDKKDECIPKTVEYLTYNEPMGIVITVLSLLGASLCLITMVIFIKNNQTPVIKASNAQLSCFLLLSLVLCFLSPLTFIVTPTVWTCMLRHTAFGLTFAVCISCVLGKTIVVVLAFKATTPGSKVARQFGPKQQRIIVCACTFIQVVIIILWLTLNPPYPDMVFQHSTKKILLECNTGSEAAFYAVLSYIGFLAVICLVLAFIARKLPDNFNEAKFITFSLLIFCAVWISFIPAYVSSPGKFTTAVETFAILSSAFGLFICIFAPKCYIILIKPERNTKRLVAKH